MIRSIFAKLFAAMMAVTIMVPNAAAAVAAATAAEQYDLVIKNGRVIDPETGLDGIRNIGIAGAQIMQISTDPLVGRETIDATGNLVVPGFIDLHSHGTTSLSQEMQVLDGVTTALELELGTIDIDDMGDLYDRGAAVNYGASASYMSARMLVKNGMLMRSSAATPVPHGLTGWITAINYAINGFEEALAPTFKEQAVAAEIQQINQALTAELEKGALGIGLTLDYMSEAIGDDELAAVFETAALHDVPLFIHIRRGINGDPAGLHEVIGLAKATGAAIHICHVTHNAMRNIDLFLAEINAARADGVDVSVELLPFEAGSTNIGAAVFRRDWRTVFAIDYDDVQRADTGERFTEDSFNAYQQAHPDGAIIHHYLTMDWTRRALQDPDMIVVSDLIPITTLDKKVPPHNTAFTRVLDIFVKQEGVLTLSDAISRMTLKPAQRMAAFAPAFARKGRLQIGADADIVVLDWDALNHQASYAVPYTPSKGVAFVIVNGVVVVQNGELQSSVKAGQMLRAR